MKVPIVGFYARQVHLLWRWSGGWLAIARQGLLIIASSLAALIFTAWLVPGLVVRDFGAAALAALALAAVSALTRPVLIALLSGISVMLVGAGTLLVQAAALVVIAHFGVIAITSLSSAAIAAVVYAITHTLLAAGLSIANDESFFGTLVRQLAARGPHAVDPASGVVFLQIDGLSYEVLRKQLDAGTMPTLARWLNEGFTLDRWEPLLPTQTSASQAGILHGNNDDIPAFRWWDKDRQHLYVSNHPADAKEIMRRVSDGTGLLVEGASIGNLLSGDARRSYLTAATLNDPARELRRSHVIDWFFVSPYAYLRWVVLSLGEVLKEIVQARAARRGRSPMGARAFPYPLARAATNVVLRHLVAALVIEEMNRGMPVIYADFVDYDEIAHHAGIDGAEARDALAGLDRILALIARAELDAPRSYRFVVLSDHGQSPGATFRQRAGRRIEDVVSDLIGGEGIDTRAATHRAEHAGRIAALVSEASLVARVLTRRSRSHDEEKLPDLVVAASGNLAHVSFPGLPGRATQEELTARHPRLLRRLVEEPWVGLVVVRSDDGRTLALSDHGTMCLGDGTYTGEDPVAPYGRQALEGLRRVDAMRNCGDLVLLSAFDGDTGEVAAFEDQIGSHGGLGGWQSDAFIAHPSEWRLTTPIVGAPMLHRALRSWVRR